MCRGNGSSKCKKRCIVYKHTCNICKARGTDAVYWGQTSKTLFERSKEHDKEFRDRSAKSHAYQHYTECHPEEAQHPVMDPYTWTWDVHSSHRTCFECVVMEAVQIVCIA